MREKGFFDAFVEKTNPALRVLEEAYDKVVFLFPNKNFEELARKLFDEYELGKLETFERLLKALKQPKSNS